MTGDPLPSLTKEWHIGHGFADPDGDAVCDFAAAGGNAEPDFATAGDGIALQQSVPVVLTPGLPVRHGSPNTVAEACANGQRIWWVQEPLKRSQVPLLGTVGALLDDGFPNGRGTEQSSVNRFEFEGNHGEPP